MMKIYTYPTADVMNDAVVNAILHKASAAIKHRDAFHLALAGGSTPKSIYELMAREPYHSNFPWDKMHFYFGDERCVPADHADSNYRMAKQALLSKVPVPEGNVHPIMVDLQDIPASARGYENELKKHLPRNDSTAVLDLVLLGIGDDGHTASLFPGTPILKEAAKWVDAVYVEKFDAWRISLTYPLINAAANVFVIAAGGGKSEVLKSVLVTDHSQSDAIHYPVQGIKPAGELVWYLDEAAAALLPPAMLTNQ
jgi:6-phosphogluconolactonase